MSWAKGTRLCVQVQVTGHEYYLNKFDLGESEDHIP